MAVLKCAFCGERLYYHGEPEGKYPVEHIFCHLKNWRKFEIENLTADWLECEHEENFIYAWSVKLAKAIKLKFEKEFPNPLPRKKLERPPIKRVEKPEDIKDDSSDDE